MIQRKNKNWKQKQQIFCTNIRLKNKPQIHFIRRIKKINDDTTENQDNLIESEILEIGTLKYASKSGQLKYDTKYILSNDNDKLQDNLLNFFEYESKNNEYSVNVFSLKKK